MSIVGVNLRQLFALIICVTQFGLLQTFSREPLGQRLRAELGNLKKFQEIH
jgi:hypothetical protein